MRKLFTLIGATLLCMNVCAEEITVGRSATYSTTSKDSITSHKNAVVTKSDGTGKTDSKKEVYYKTGTKTKVSATCYLNQNSSKNRVTSTDTSVYAGYKIVVANGYQFTLSKLNISVAVGDTFSYKARILNSSNDTIYKSNTYTVTDYTKTTGTNFDAEESISDVVLTEGTYYVNLYYWLPGSTSNKYLVPINLSVTGNLEETSSSTTKTSTSVSLNQTSLNLSVGGDAVTLKATTSPADLAVTWSSSNTSVATVSDAGVVTPVAAGSATITAKYAGSDEYKSSKATCAVTVTKELIAISEPKSFNFVSSSSSEYKAVTYLNDYVKIYANSSKSVKVGSSGIALGGAGSLSDGYRYIEFVVSGPSRIIVTQNASKDRTLKIDAGSTNIGTSTTTGSDVTDTINYEVAEKSSIYIYSASNGINVKSLSVTPLVKITTGKQYVTYSNSEYALDFSNTSNIKAYTAAINSGGTAVDLTAANTVPAGVGVVLYSSSSDGVTEYVPATTSTETSISGNELVAVSTATTLYNERSATKVKYILQDGTFKKCTTDSSNPNTLAAGKAYLESSTTVNESSAKALPISLDGQLSGINEVKTSNAKNGKVYNMQGIEVSNPSSGLYIINGKKVILK